MEEYHYYVHSLHYDTGVPQLLLRTFFLSWQVSWLNVLILFSFLMKSKKDLELRKWAAEGLSFLTMEADVKVHLNIQNQIAFALQGHKKG